MNIGCIICGSLCLLFLLLTFLFIMLQDRAALLISGWNTLPKNQKHLYDIHHMVRDQRNSFLLWSFIQAIGAIFSYVFSSYFAIAACVLWLIIFFKDVHLDTHKAFEKYKKI